MTFWLQTNFIKEPLRQNRWYITFGTDLDQFVYALKECKKPEYEIGVTEHRLLTHVFRYPTLLKWKPVTIKYVSAIGGNYFTDDPRGEKAGARILKKNPQNVARANAVTRATQELNVKLSDKASKNHLANLLEGISLESGYKIPNNVHQSIKKQDSEISIGQNINLTQIDENGTVIETWTLQNPFISGVDYGSLTYENENFVDITITLQYDWAERISGDKAIITAQTVF